MCKLLCASLLMLCSAAGYSTTVYKTVEDDGVVSFSDTPPDGALPTEVLQITPAKPQSPEEYLERLNEMRMTTDRMAADRREREKHRAELKEIHARTASHEQPEQPSLTRYTDYFPVYSRRYRRPGYRPKPVHPIVRPPLRNSGGAIGSRNAQLMRPLVSSRR